MNNERMFIWDVMHNPDDDTYWVQFRTPPCKDQETAERFMWLLKDLFERIVMPILTEKRK